ncbi:tRNA modification GTPase MnmE [Spirochaetia bacterium]|nr:tRNA modification GTPase MnmE [Spirochaetia bacterium]
MDAKPAISIPAAANTTGAAYGDDAPIAAPATPLAESALALIRVSGNKALELLSALFSPPKKILDAPGYSIVHGWIVNPSNANSVNSNSNSSIVDSGVTAFRRIDEVLISVYRSPRSYTGEDGADISCHGGVAAVKAVMAALKIAGFRDALPGEFTFRAFMNGKLDLTRSESVMELVSAKTGRSLRQAVNRLSGALEKEIRDIKNLLVQALAETEIYLDYSEDEFGGRPGGSNADTGTVTGGKAAAEAIAAEAAGKFPGLAMTEQARSRLQTLAASYRRERLYLEGALAVIAGRPNAGKSSLFNLLLKEDRSIVNEAPGTTRDWIEALVSIEDIPVRLADTAGLRGLRDSAGPPDAPAPLVSPIPLDPVEKIGIERSRELLAQADLILYLIDGSEGIAGEDRVFLQDFCQDAAQKTPVLLLWNKADIATAPKDLSLAGENFYHSIREAMQGKESESGAAVLEISAKTGAGIPALSAAMAKALTAGNAADSGGNSPGIASARQKDLVDAALAAAEEALLLAEGGEPLDLIAPLLREAVNSLGEITGEVSTADILETMFSRFCVGK